MDANKIWSQFYKHFGKIYRDENGNFSSEKMVGYDAMINVEKYAKSHKEIKIIHCDDSVFASSMIVLIPHPKMGISFIFIPQCTSVKGELFLYPNSIASLADTLLKIKKEYINN